ncbi:MAG: deoxyribodipyrimidine photo-lyase [Pseudomonadota bacterium]
MAAGPIILWYRNDLRLMDLPSLAAACATGQPILPVYILDTHWPGQRVLGGASQWWLHHSLEKLQANWQEHGGKLLLKRGDPLVILQELTDEVGASGVYCSRAYEPWAGELEKSLHTALSERDIALKRYGGSLLHDPDHLTTKAGQPFKVYTPFWRALSQQDVRSPVDGPADINVAHIAVENEDLDDWALLPTRPDWAGGLRDSWVPGEGAARQRLKQFLGEDAFAYATERDRPDLPATSRLSPHLRFGEISPAVCWHAAALEAAKRPQAETDLEVFRKELVWRDFSYHLLYHWPSLPDTAFRDNFNAFPWQDNDEVRTAWQKGQTGYPIVDAGMRELWHTGWMHNRVRMIVASFLTKHLLQPWQAGEAWFWDCLVDADLASNAASWQWVAGSGADAAPYFRIFNPITQGEKFDPEGAYVRRWVPELAALPNRYLHAPWTCPELELRSLDIVLGQTYPEPIVDHPMARQRALASYEQVKVRR